MVIIRNPQNSTGNSLGHHYSRVQGRDRLQGLRGASSIGVPELSAQMPRAGALMRPEARQYDANPKARKDSKGRSHHHRTDDPTESWNRAGKTSNCLCPLRKTYSTRCRVAILCVYFHDETQCMHSEARRSALRNTVTTCSDPHITVQASSCPRDRGQDRRRETLQIRA